MYVLHNQRTMIKTSVGELKLSPLKEEGKFVFYNDFITINGKVSKGDKIKYSFPNSLYPQPFLLSVVCLSGMMGFQVLKPCKLYMKKYLRFTKTGSILAIKPDTKLCR